MKPALVVTALLLLIPGMAGRVPGQSARSRGERQAEGGLELAEKVHGVVELPCEPTRSVGRKEAPPAEVCRGSCWPKWGLVNADSLGLRTLNCPWCDTAE